MSSLLPRPSRPLLVLTVALAVAPSILAAQAMSPDSARTHDPARDMPGMAAAPAASPMMHAAGGTAREPEATPMAMLRGRAGAWSLLLHGDVSELYLREPTVKGGWVLGSLNWAMAAAERPAAGGRLGLVLGGSAEALTLNDCGYPLLLAVGPSCARNPAGDFQHPHPPVMELAARYARPLGGALALDLYGGPVGEPALGPPSYLHRLSAAGDPVAPITFHEMNPAHASDGVLTAGVEARRWKLEASAFSGVQADASRVLPRPHALDSQAARLWLTPAPAWSLQLSAGRIAPPPAGAPSHHAGAEGALHALSASASYTRSGARGGFWAATAGWARLADATGARTVALLESTVQVGERHTLFARAELAGRGLEHITIIEQPDGSHLHLVSSVPYHAGELSAGYALGARLRGLHLSAGVRGSLSFIPGTIAADYGSPGRAPAGFGLFGSLAPASAR